MTGGDELYDFSSESPWINSLGADEGEDEGFDDGVESDLVSPDVYDFVMPPDEGRLLTSRER